MSLHSSLYVISETFSRCENQISFFNSLKVHQHNIFSPFIIVNKFMNSNKFWQQQRKIVSIIFFSAEDTDNGEASTCGKILIFLSWVLVFLTMPISLLVCFKVSYVNVICCLTSIKISSLVSPFHSPFFCLRTKFDWLQTRSYKTEISLVNN